MDDNAEEQTPYEELPLIGTIKIDSRFASNADMLTNVTTTGDMSLVTVLGLLRLAEDTILAGQAEQRDIEPDPGEERQRVTVNIIAEADRWLESHKHNETWGTMSRLRDELVRVAGGR